MILQLIGILLIIAIAWYLLQNLTLSPPVRMVVIVVGCVLLIVWVVSAFGLTGGLGLGRLSLR
jgi:hypothetical protein